METFKTFFLWTWRVTITVLVGILILTMGNNWNKTDRLSQWVQSIAEQTLDNRDDLAEEQRKTLQATKTIAADLNNLYLYINKRTPNP